MLADATLLNLATTKVVLMLAMACSVGCFAVVLMRLLAAPFRRLKAGPRHMCTALSALMLVCLVWAQKSGDGGDDGDSSGGTNDVMQVSGTNDTDDAGLDGMGPLMMMGSMAPDLSPVIDAADIARGYRLESSTVNGQISYEMPEGVSPAGTWHLTGAYDDVLSVDLDGFVFPLGRELCSSLWAHTWGTARTHLRNQTNELVAVGTPMSALPGFSRFWTAQTTNDTFLLTWENFTLGRIPVSTNASSLIPDPSSLLSAQIELFRSGDFIARSNDVESVYRRINPDDWDDDGVENDLDEEPTVYDEDGFGPHQELPQDARTNFYYWVDLVVSNGNALVEFEGDGDSDLPDPRFIARSGETNRVYLLIGKTYQAQCVLPMVCVAREDADIQVSPGVSGLHFCWDITLEYVPEPPMLLMSQLLSAPLAPGGTHALIQPERARGGLFDWPGSFCCYYLDADGSPVFFCTGNCGCGGGCHTGDISYTYVGYSRTFSGWSCSCSGSDDDVPGGGDDPEVHPEGPNVSAVFSKDAVIFEEAYTNMPGVVVPRQSTEVEVSYYVYGGTNGGTYAFTLLNGSRLELVSGDTLPVTGHVAAAESRTITARYRGRLPSASENDVEAVATFVEDVTARTLPAARDQMTTVKIELESKYAASENACKQRHVYGVAETVYQHIYPVIDSGTWSVTINDQPALLLQSGQTGFCASWTAGIGVVSFSALGVSYSTSFSVLEPWIEVRNPRANQSNVSPVIGESGHLLLFLDQYVGPFYVSFREVYMMEVADEGNNCPHSGYFNDPSTGWWSHNAQTGAGVWNPVGENGYWGYDKAGYAGSYASPWTEGEKEWEIPIGWGFGGESVVGTIHPNPTTERFVIHSNGTFKISKHGHSAERNTLGLIWVDDSLVLWPW